MSRCFPYPPPGYTVRRSDEEAALIESIKVCERAPRFICIYALWIGWFIHVNRIWGALYLTYTVRIGFMYCGFKSMYMLSRKMIRFRVLLGCRFVDVLCTGMYGTGPRKIRIWTSSGFHCLWTDFYLMCFQGNSCVRLIRTCYSKILWTELFGTMECV